MLVITKQQKFYNEETNNFCSMSVTDDLFVHSALPPATKTHSSYQVKLQKKRNLHKNSQAVTQICLNFCY